MIGYKMNLTNYIWLCSSGRAVIRIAGILVVFHSSFRPGYSRGSGLAIVLSMKGKYARKFIHVFAFSISIGRVSETEKEQ